MSGRDEQSVISLQCPFCDNDTAFWILKKSGKDTSMNWGWFVFNEEYDFKMESMLKIKKPFTKLMYLDNLDEVISIKCRDLKIHMHQMEDRIQHVFYKGDKIFEGIMKIVRQNKCVK